MAGSVPLRTTRGRLAMPDYLRQSGGAAYYTTRELGSLQEKVLAEGRDVPAIDASWFAVPAFLQAYAVLHPDVALVHLDDDMDAMLRPVAAGEFAELVSLCEELGFATRVAAFRPADLPAVLTYPAHAESIREAASALDEGLVPDGFSGLLRGYVDQHRDAADGGGTLHLNADGPLIRRLAGPGLRPARRQAAMAVIAHFARLFCGRMLDAAKANADIAAWRRSLEGLLEP